MMRTRRSIGLGWRGVLLLSAVPLSAFPTTAQGSTPEGQAATDKKAGAARPAPAQTPPVAEDCEGPPASCYLMPPEDQPTKVDRAVPRDPTERLASKDDKAEVDLPGAPLVLRSLIPPTATTIAAESAYLKALAALLRQVGKVSDSDRAKLKRKYLGPGIEKQ